MVKVTEPEWRTELDRLRGRPQIKEFTPEQVEFLRYARESENPVSWTGIAKLWKEQGWTELKEGALRRRYLTEIEEGTP